MNDANDHSWDLQENEKGNLPDDDEVFDQKMDEWQARDWPDWLSKHLTLPFAATREEDDDDAYFMKGAAAAPFRLGHKMQVVQLSEEDVDRGVMVIVRERNKTGCVPLSDLKVTPRSNRNFWPVREYVVWYANRP